jgi:hypothetical protein
MDQYRIHFAGCQCQIPGSVSINFEGPHDLRFANIHPVKGTGIDDELGLVDPDSFLDLFEKNDIELPMSGPDYFMVAQGRS